MSFEEEFLVATAVFDDDKKKSSKKKVPQGSGCMVSVMTILLVVIFCILFINI